MAKENTICTPNIGGAIITRLLKMSPQLFNLVIHIKYILMKHLIVNNSKC